MVRISNIDQGLDLYCTKRGTEEVRRVENKEGRYTLASMPNTGKW